MNKDKAPMPRDGDSGDGLPPPSSRAAGAPPKSSTPPLEYDISRMPDFPTRNTGHRRAHSEILSLPDDLDLSAPGGGDGPSLSDENDEELFSMLNSSCGTLSEAEAESSSAGGGRGEGVGPGQATRPRHQHSQSMDESMSIKAEELVGAPGTEGMSPAEAKKAVSAAKLAELALVDPKRAKRSVSHCCSRLLVTFLLLYKLLHAVWLAWFIFETGLVNSILLNRSIRTKWFHL
jgi:hypothetical protein